MQVMHFLFECFLGRAGMQCPAVLHAICNLIGNIVIAVSLLQNRPFTSRTADQTGSTIISSQLTPSNQHQLGQSSQSWSTQSLDEQNQEVRYEKLNKEIQSCLYVYHNLLSFTI